jgi:hypothetical protein
MTYSQAFILVSMALSWGGDAIASRHQIQDRRLYKAEKHLYASPHGQPTEDLKCSDLIHRQWSFPDQMVAQYCEVATRACIVEGLVKSQLAKPFIKDQDRGVLESDLERARQKKRADLLGCQLGLDAINSGYSDIRDAAAAH